MILTVNVGNTNINGGLFHPEGGQPVCRFCIPADAVVLTGGSAGAEAIAEQLRRRLPAEPTLTGAALASVVPEKTPLLAAAIEELLGRPPLVLANPGDTGIDLSRYDSTLVGMDRLVCCVGAKDRYPLPLAVFDLGTATSISVLDGEGVFLGGAILAGVQMGLQALAGGTALLPKVALPEKPSLVGRDTAGCLAAGAMYGMAGAIDGYASRLEEEMGRPLSLVATGGNAPRILPHCRAAFSHEPDLLQHGLWHLHSMQ